MDIIFLRIGALLGGLAVLMGAFGAHALKSRLSDYALGVFETAVQYQMYHALALIGLALLMRTKAVAVTWPGWCLVAGVVIFSGSLYALALTGVKKWGAVTPIGGLLFVLGWMGLVLLVKH